MTDDILVTSRERAYFTIIPNLVDDLELTPYAFRLYVHLRRVAGEDGKCWQSTQTLGKACRMSAGAVSKAKQELVSAGLVLLTKVSRPGGGKPYHVLTITDIWAQNMAQYAKGLEANSPGEIANSPGEIKKNPLKKEPKARTKEREAGALQRPSGEEHALRPTMLTATAFFDIARPFLQHHRREPLQNPEAFYDSLWRVFDHHQRHNGDSRLFWDALNYYATIDQNSPVHEIPHRMRNALKRWKIPADYSRGGESFRTENFAAFVQAMGTNV